MEDPHTTDVRPQLARDNIVQQLVNRLSFEQVDAEIFVRHPVVEKVHLFDMLQRIDAVLITLGPEIGKMLLQSRPECASYRLQHLHQRYVDFQRDGYFHIQIVRILSLCVEIADLDNVEFYRTHNEICRILPVRDHRHQIVNHEPQIYLLPADRLRKGKGTLWNGSPAYYWNAICVSISEESAGASPKDSPSATSALSEAGEYVYTKLALLGISEAVARVMADKLFKAHGEKCSEVFDAFVAHQWSAFDITCLMREKSHPGWRTSPSILLNIEKTMIFCGLPAKDVRDFLIDNPDMSEADPRAVHQAITTFLEIGFGASEIMRFAKRRPKVLSASPDQIREWHTIVGAKGLLAAEYLHALLKVPKRWQQPSQAAMRPPPVPREGRRQISTKEAPRRSPPIRKPPPCALPAVSEPAQKPTREETDEVGKQVVYRSESSTPAQHMRGWKTEIKKILRITDDKWFTEHWPEFEEKSAWMWDRSGPAPAILDHFALWLNVREFHAMDSPALQFIAKLLKSPELHSVLQLSPPALQHRLAAIRRYVGRDFTDETELLLLKWERVTPDELRYRVHTIESHGKEANRAPYLIMLVEPSREEFLARLERTLAIERRA